MHLPPTGQQSYLLLRTSPPVIDPRELQTIIEFSLRALYGDFNPHRVDVLACRESAIIDDDSSIDTDKNIKGKKKKKKPKKREYEAVVCTDVASVGSVRAACTFCSPPPHLKGIFYRLDCVAVEDSLGKLGWDDDSLR